MLNHIFFLPLLTAAVLTAAGCSDKGPEEDTIPTGPVYSNVYFENPVIAADRPDPTVWQYGSTYYTLSTGVNPYIWTSPDLVEWTKSSTKPHTTDDVQEAKKVGTKFWAPDMVRIGNYWNLYITLYNAATDCGIALFRSTTATGPFTWSGVITHSSTNGGIKDTIDPEVVTDPETGKVWLFFGSTGKMHRVELNKDGTALAEGATYTHVAGLDVNDNPSRSKVFEGAYLHKHGDWWYLFASAGLYLDATYRMVVGRSKSLLGEFVDKEGRKMTEGFASEVIASQSGDAFFGPGHNSEIFTDRIGQDYILYHCHNESVEGSATRRYLMLQRLYWDEEGWPYVKDGKPAARDVAPKL